MQMQCTHKNKSNNLMIEIPSYIVLPDKTDELHIKPLRIEQNISCRMEVSSPKKSLICTSEVLLLPLLECPQRNQNKMSPKEPKQNVPEGTRTWALARHTLFINTLQVI